MYKNYYETMSPKARRIIRGCFFIAAVCYTVSIVLMCYRLTYRYWFLFGAIFVLIASIAQTIQIRRLRKNGKASGEEDSITRFRKKWFP